MLLLLMASVLAAAAGPEDPRTYGDWTIGCDNGLACEAIALVPEAGGEEWLIVSLARGPEEMAEVRFHIGPLDKAPARLSIDGKPYAVRFTVTEEGYALVPERSDELVDALREGTVARLSDGSGAPVGQISLKGAAAAMRAMDERQHRGGRASALAARGPRQGLVEPPPALPRLTLAPAATAPTPALSDKRADLLRREAGCTLEEVGGPDSVETFPLSPGRTLILLACGSGAYNVSHLVFIAREAAGRVHVEPATFDEKAPRDEGDRVTLVNAAWDPQTRRLDEFPRGRGLGDCGTRSTYGWDGQSFRLLEREVMGECRGSIDYIRIWRALPAED